MNDDFIFIISFLIYIFNISSKDMYTYLNFVIKVNYTKEF